MYIHRSNRLERLVEVLAELLARSGGDALAPECIVVQGRGMERWLSMQLARRLGIWANPDFPFPRKLIERAIAAVLGADGALSPCFAPEMLLWSVADLLPAHLGRPEFAPIRTYLADDTNGTKRVQLAERIASTFDQYVVYRPQMVLGWERGGGVDWQAVLWRALVARHGATHITARAAAFFAALRSGAPHLDAVPARIALFGISTLPPLYLDILAALAEHVELHLFILSPSREYWAEIRSRREALRTLANATDADSVLHALEGHPLLASLGRLGRDFQQLLEGAVDYREDARDLYDDPAADTMLATLQSDILSLRRRGVGNAEAPCRRLDPMDASIAIHACHSPMREVEVLHDQLLALFEDSTLVPHDVVVMSPAIDAYAPFIDAVFGGAEHRPRIPYRIADRRVRATDDVVDTFFTLLAALRGRMTATAVLDLLGRDAIRTRFGIVADDLDQLRTWVSDAGIRWGIDPAHRQTEQQPALAEHTWRFGLDRLLLGYAMPGAGRALYAGVLPYDDVEGGPADLLGRFVEFCDALFSFHRALQAPRTLDAWRGDLGALLDALVASTNQTAYQHQQIRVALADLAQQADAGGFREPVDFDVVQMQLAAALERAAPGRGFLTGGVTFCALVPMRSIPFRVVCLLGMNDADFPRVRRPPGFDLIGQHPRPGDRSSRDDDRYLFLEALLSARERLLITYVGQSIRDSSPIPPSVVVSELLDTLGESFRAGADALTDDAAQAAIRDRLVTQHPLQPFSPRYFAGAPATRLFSFADSYCAGAQALTRARNAVPPFVAVPLPPAPRAQGDVALDDLARFFENPARAFLQNRLGLYLGTDMTPLNDQEPLALDGLDRWKVATGLLERMLAGEDFVAALPSVRASGALPPGRLGDCAFADLEPEVTGLEQAVVKLVRGAELEAVVLDDQLDGTRITGVIRNLWPAGQVRHQCSRVGGRHELGLWIRHLVLNWLRPHGYPLQSYLVGRTAKDSGVAVVRFRAVDDAAAILRTLLRLFALGQTVPLPFFPRAARAYVEALQRGRSEAQALEDARKAYEGNHIPGDGGDAYVSQAFDATDPLNAGFSFTTDVDVTTDAWPQFAAVARMVFGPMLAHREELT